MDIVERLRAEVADAVRAIDTLHDQRRKLEAEVEALLALLRKAGAAIHYHRREQGYDKSQLESEIEAMLAAKEQL